MHPSWAKNEFTKIPIRSDQQRAALIRPVKHGVVVDAGIKFSDVVNRMSIRRQAVNDSSIYALIGQEAHAHPVQS